MKPCDIYIALGTVYKKSFIVAKKKFNATTILEWGSKHIEEQQRIMSEIHGLQQQSKYFTQRSLKGYMIADYISIASDHVKQSFIVRGISEGKLIENPYGVDLSMFKPTELIKDNSYDLLMVGGWSYRKGCDLLSKLCAGSSYKFLHVGPLVDMDFPQHENMTHIDSVDQWQLVNYYAKARVFVLPSREEGLAMVQAQALACGLPIVCSAHTGGRDLQRYINDKSWIVEMQEYTIDALNKCIMKALQLSKTQLGLRAYAGPACEQLTWKAYGERYNQTLEDVQSSKRGRDL
jgi:glycosyltransferase involved in cell wall biosynthesis